MIKTFYLQDSPLDLLERSSRDGLTRPDAVARKVLQLTVQGISMKVLTLALVITPLISPALAFAQNGHMMNGAWMGGYGGIWMPILLVLVVGLVAWVVMQKRK